MISEQEPDKCPICDSEFDLSLEYALKTGDLAWYCPGCKIIHKDGKRIFTD